MGSRTKVFSLAIIGMMLVMSASSLFGQALAEDGAPEPPLPEFLQVGSNFATDYDFTARGACVLCAEVKDVAITSLALDGENFELSYGYNAYPVNFGADFAPHHITLPNPEYFSELYVQNLVLYDETFQLSADNAFTRVINLQAGGLVHFLIRYNFHRDDLKFVADGVLLKDFHPHDPVTEPMTLSLGQLAFLEYSLEMTPGTHEVRVEALTGGSVELVAFTNFDYDKDHLETDEELKLSREAGLSDVTPADPTVPDAWGFFERGDDAGFDADSQPFEFDLFVPAGNPLSNYLYLNVAEGTITGLMLDDDTLTFAGQEFAAGSHFLANLAPGYHKIIGQASGDYYSIDFRLNLANVLVKYLPEFSDQDADGIKDAAEVNSGMDPFSADSDADGLPDNFDQSPLSSLILQPNQFLQVALPTQAPTTTLLSIQVRKPNTDRTCTRLLWRNSVEASIIPAMRLFGSPSMTQSALCSYASKEPLAFNLASDPLYSVAGPGDAVPDAKDAYGPFTIVPIKFSEAAWDADVIYPANHPAKASPGGGRPATLDIRLDFAWVVLQEDPQTGETGLLHIYPMEESITIRAMATKEVGAINYAYATPDSFVEHKIIDALVENPTLGAFADYGVGDDILAAGTGTYDQFLTGLLGNVKGIAVPADQNQVLYVAGTERNVDVLNRIRVHQGYAGDPQAKNEGEVETAFVFNTLAGESQAVDQSVVNSGEYRIVESKYNSEFEGSGPRLAINERTIAIKRIEFGESHSLLECTKVYGNSYENINTKIQRIGNLHPQLRLNYETFIELNKPIINDNPPSLLFEKEYDISKNYYDNRQNEINLDAQLYETHSPAILSFLLSRYRIMYDQIYYIASDFNSFYDNVLPGIQALLQNDFDMPDDLVDLLGERMFLLKDQVDELNLFTNQLDDYLKTGNYIQDQVLDDVISKINPEKL